MCEITASYRLNFPWYDGSVTPPINEAPGTVRTFTEWVTVLQIGSNTILCDYMVDFPAWYTQVPAPGIVTSWTGQQGSTRTGPVVAQDGDYNASMIEARGLTPGATLTEQTDYLYNNLSGGGDHLSIVSTLDTVPGPLYDKLDLVGFTKAIVNGGSNELLRFTGTPAGGAGGTFPVLLYEDTAGGIAIPRSGSFVDITFNTSVLTTAAVTTADGITFTINQDGTYFIYACATQETGPGPGRTEHQVRAVVDTGAGYGELSGSSGYGYTTNAVADMQTVETGLVPFIATTGDTLKIQVRASGGVNDGALAGVATKVLVFRHDIGSFLDLTDTPNSYAGAAGQVVRVNAGETGLEFAAGGGGAPTNATYVTMSLDATLTNERVLTAGSGLALTDGGAGGNATLGMDISPLTTTAAEDGDFVAFEDITDNGIKKTLTSTGGNDTADSGKIAIYGLEGQLRASVTNAGIPGVWSVSAGTGYAGYFQSGAATETAKVLNGGTGPGLHGRAITNNGIQAFSDEGVSFYAESSNFDAVGTPDIAHFASAFPAVTRMTVGYDGGVTWTGTGAASTRTGLGLGTIATQNANAVAITGGSITGITDLAVADGGTGASTAAAARTNLGAAPLDATYIVQTANGELSNEQALSSLSTGLVKVTTGTGVLSTAVEGADYYGPGGTDVAIADGGTGASTAAGAFTNLKQAATTTDTGVVELATDGENAASVVVQGNDNRINRVQYAVMSADSSSTSTSLADVGNGLTATLEAGAKYLVEVRLPFRTAATTTGIGLSLNGSTAATLVNGRAVVCTGTTTAVSYNFRAYNDFSASTGVDAASTNIYAEINAMILNGGSSSTLNVRFASEVAASQVTIEADGAMMIVTKVS